MKIFTSILFVIAISTTAFAQNLIINGSFENNTATGNTPNLTSAWPTTVSDSWEVDGGEMNLDTSYACGTASDGNWFVTNCPICPPAFYMAFSFRLSQRVIAGDTLTFSFDKQSCGDSTAIDFTLTDDSTMMGTVVHTFTGPTSSSWVHESYTFQAPVDANFVTVDVNISNATTGLLALDNFRLKPGTCSAYYTLHPDFIPHTWTAVNEASGVAPLTYNWNWGDGNNSPGAYPSHTFATAGNYDICLSITDALGCADTYCDSSTYLYRSAQGAMVTVNVISGITGIQNPIDVHSGMTVFPDPATDLFIVKTDVDMENAELQIYNVLGAVVREENFSGNSKEVDVSQIPAGIYFVKVTGSAREYLQKLVVRKN